MGKAEVQPPPEGTVCLLVNTKNFLLIPIVQLSIRPFVHFFSHALSKGAVGVAALGAIAAKASMAQQCKLSFSYPLSGENPWQHQVQNRNAME